MTRRRPSFDLAALRNPAFRLLGFSQIVSVAADQVLNVAITISVLNTGADASVLGLVLACRGLGLLLFLLVGGVWVDRLPRRRVVVAAYWVQALAVGILFLASAHPLLWLLAGVNFLAGTLEAFIRPAFNALLSTILAEDQRISGRALIAVALRTAMIAGPGMCVALIALVGPRAAFGLTTAVFVLTAIVFLRVKEPEAAPQRDESVIAGIATGFAALRSRPRDRRHDVAVDLRRRHASRATLHAARQGDAAVPHPGRSPSRSVGDRSNALRNS